MSAIKWLIFAYINKRGTTTAVICGRIPNNPIFCLSEMFDGIQEVKELWENGYVNC